MGNSCLNVDTKSKKTKVTHRRPTMEREPQRQRSSHTDFDIPNPQSNSFEKCPNPAGNESQSRKE